MGCASSVASSVAEDPWQPVKDEATGGTYWHNTKTDQVTPVGVPKPDDTGGFRFPLQITQADLGVSLAKHDSGQWVEA